MDTVDSCTAVKHTLRASDLATVKRIEEMSGVQTIHTFQWVQSLDDGDDLDPERAVEGLVQIGETHGPVLDRNTIAAVSSDPLTSFLRFTTQSGYTQFGGKTVLLRSLAPFDRETYRQRKHAPWPALPEDTPTPSGGAAPASPPASPASPDTPPESRDWDARFRADGL